MGSARREQIKVISATMSKSADGGSPLAGEYHLLGKSGDDEKKTIILEPVSCRQKGPKVV